MDPKPEKNENLPQPPEQRTGAGAGSAPAENAAEQPSGDDSLTRSEMAAKRRTRATRQADGRGS